MRIILGLIFVTVAAASALGWAKSLRYSEDYDIAYALADLTFLLLITLLGIAGMKMIRRPGAQPAKNEEPLDEVVWIA